MKKSLALLALLATLPVYFAQAEQSMQELLHNEVYPYQEAHGGILSIDSINLNQTSSNYSRRTPSGNSSVYFYVPIQTNITHSEVRTPNRNLWSGKSGHASVTAIVTDEFGVRHDAILRIQKKFGGRWLKMNDGIQRGHGQVRVSLNRDDNLYLPAGFYTTEFIIVGAGWHAPQDFRVAIRSLLSFRVGVTAVTAEVNPDYCSPPPPDGCDEVCQLGSASSLGGAGQMCALQADNTVRCWGANNLEPTDVPADLGPVKQLALGFTHTCVLQADDEVRCWGSNGVGETDVPADLGAVTQIASGGYFTCALQADNTIRCWGANFDGQTDVPADPGTVKQIAAGASHVCALNADDSVRRCWGANNWGQINLPERGLGGVKQIALGFGHNCVIRSDDTVNCWGRSGQGQSSVPRRLGKVKQIALGRDRSCAIKMDNTVQCWGLFREVPADLGEVKQIVLGGFGREGCALKTDNTVQCWPDDNDNVRDLPDDLGEVKQL